MFQVLEDKQATHFHDVIDAVVGVVAGQGGITEDAGSSIQLQLQLGSQSALEVDSPQRLVLGDGHALDLSVDDFDLERLLNVFLVDDAALSSRISFDQLGQNVFVVDLGLVDPQLKFSVKFLLKFK
jgi:hypothetical protein